ncbi:glutathione binding protein [Aureococcus anophagefferens]|uniref:Glutathione binding protein n=1 Tax=Aureococcus anophagefferens TaxID=44056 RepID=A0ABR1FG92_AURAN
MAAHSDTKEARCFECPSSRDYDKEAGSRLVDAVRGDRVSVAMSLRLEEFEDDIAGRLMENCEIRLAVPALAEQRRADGQDSVYVGEPGVAFYLGRRGDAATARALVDFHTRDGDAPPTALDCSLLCGATGLDLAADEWLYGKAGFLRALLGLRRLAKRRRLAALEDALAVAATRVAAALLDDGRSELDEILRYSWHGTPYVGAAHGTGGICYLLLCAARDDAQLAAKAYPYVRATLKALAALAVDGNWPAVAGEARAPLVHFCHGAPGMVFAFFEGAKVFKDAALKTAALDAAYTTWKYGLLFKGPGLCHGIAGNGYALLAAFRATGDVKWLHRACVFAETAVAEDTIAMSHTPDHPLSLFEGLAGCACFLRDLRQHPKDAELPFFEFHGL